MLVDVVYNVIQEFLIERESLFVKEVIDYSTPLPPLGGSAPSIHSEFRGLTTDLLLLDNKKQIKRYSKNIQVGIIKDSLFCNF